MGKLKSITYRILRDTLVDDLNRLIRVFEIYLYEITSKIEIKRILPDIKNTAIDKVLSFNYTDTYRKVYDIRGRAEYDYIHGKINKKDSIVTNNLVLGIEEYLSGERKDQEIEFIAFKKFYQRIYKQTGSLYKQWVYIVKEDYQKDYEKMNNFYKKEESNIFYRNQGKESIIRQYSFSKHNLYIFGHSLDVTDKIY